MSTSDSITLRQYYLSFKSISGAMAGLFTAIPLLSKLAPDGYAAYGFPPLGSVEGPARIGTFVFAWAATYFAFFARSGSPSGDRKQSLLRWFLRLSSASLFWSFPSIRSI